MTDILSKTRLEDEVNLIEDFILLTYSTPKDSLEISLVGTDSTKKKLVIYNTTKQSLSYAKDPFTFENDREIELITITDFHSRGSTDYLLISKENGIFKNRIIYRVNTGTEYFDLPDSTSVPLLFCYNTARPALLIQNDKETNVVLFAKEKIKEVTFVNQTFPKIHPRHSSAFLTLDDKYSTNLALETFENQKRQLQIYSVLNENGFTKFKSENVIDLPDKIGPLLFYDVNNNGRADIVFVSEENGVNFFNVLINTNLFKGKSSLKIQLSKKCVIEENDLPSGIYPVDLYVDSQFRFVIKTQGDPSSFILIENDNGWKENNSIFQLSIPGLKSYSFADLDGIGRESLVLNYKKDNKIVLAFRRNNLLKKDSFYFSILTYDGYGPKNNFPSSIPGVIYRFTYLENTKSHVGHQRPQSTFNHLKTPFLYFGIGTSPLLIEFKGLGCPFMNLNEPFKIHEQIIPNSKLAVHPVNGHKLKLSLCLSIKENVKVVLLVYVILFCISLGFVIWLDVRERKRKQEQRKEEALLFNFDAL